MQGGMPLNDFCGVMDANGRIIGKARFSIAGALRLDGAAMGIIGGYGNDGKYDGMIGSMWGEVGVRN